jgi:large subunit ribosomal protein L10
VKREKKEKIVQELKESFHNHDSFYLVDFINMPVSQFVELRKKIRENSYSFLVVKNRLALRALKDDYPDDLKVFFQGPTAIGFTQENPIGLAHLIKNFSTKHKVLTVKGGMLEGQFFPGERFDEIASLNTREELLAKIGYLMACPLVKLARTWQAPLDSLGRLLSHLKTKK